MLENIRTASIIGMSVSFLIAVGLPVAAFIFWRKRTRARWSSMLIGAAVFILFALVLEQLLHLAVLDLTGTKLTGNIWLFALYGGICAGLFEETGRILAMKFCMKKTLDKKNAIMYGIGHGGIEAILLVGLSMFSNIITAVIINSGLLETSLNVLDEATRAATVSQLSALWTTQPYLFYMGGIERVSAFFLHIALSYIVYRAVKLHKIRYYFAAVLIHFLVDAATLLISNLLPIPVLEGLLLAAVIVLWVFIRRAYVSEEQD